MQLLKIHGIRQFGFGKRNRLLERGLLVKRMDMAIQREGGVSVMPYEALRWVNKQLIEIFFCIRIVKLKIERLITVRTISQVGLS